MMDRMVRDSAVETELVVSMKADVVGLLTG
jgi:hypothetical protein